MTDAEMRTWHDPRESLFPTRLPYSAIANINAQLPKLEFQRASNALTTYSQEKPYRGFYMTRFNVHYERQPSAGNAAPERRAPPPGNDGNPEADQRAERELYAALPEAFATECKARYGDWGWGTASRAFRILCIDAYHRADVERYRVHGVLGGNVDAVA
jgi:hypothetical protein